MLAANDSDAAATPDTELVFGSLPPLVPHAAAAAAAPRPLYFFYAFMKFDEGVTSVGMDWSALTACVLRMTRVHTAVLGFRASDDLQLFLTEAPANRLERLRLERRLRYAFRERGQPEGPWVVYEGAESAGEWKNLASGVRLWAE